MKNGILVRGMLAVAAALTLSTAGVITFASQAGAATPAITVTPNSGLQATGSTVVTVAGTGYAASSAGAVLECNNDTSQPTVSLTAGPISETVPVSCGPPPSATGLTMTGADGSFSTSFTVTTGTVGPPCGASPALFTCPATDSTGGSPATDAAKFPCPPTAAQQTAGDSCVLAFGDASGGQAQTNISFAGPCAAPPGATGYDLAASDGGVFTFGTLPFCGSAGSLKLNKPVVGIALTHDGAGYWLVATDGGIFNYGDAKFFGSTGSTKLNQPIVGMAATPDGAGYWLVAADGGIFNYGDAGFFGSAGSLKLNKPIVGMASTSDGKGYWLVASDGGIFSYGDATFLGSTGSIKLNQPIVGMGATPDGKGYWLVASDGGIFNYGTAGFFGSTGSIKLNKPIVGMTSTPTGKGYLLVAADGGIFNYGDAKFLGSTGSIKLNAPIVGAGAAGPPPA